MCSGSFVNSSYFDSLNRIVVGFSEFDRAFRSVGSIPLAFRGSRGFGIADMLMFVSSGPFWSEEGRKSYEYPYYIYDHMLSIIHHGAH